MRRVGSPGGRPAAARAAKARAPGGGGGGQVLCGFGGLRARRFPRRWLLGGGCGAWLGGAGCAVGRGPGARAPAGGRRARQRARAPGVAGAWGGPGQSLGRKGRALGACKRAAAPRPPPETAPARAGVCSALALDGAVGPGVSSV